MRAILLGALLVCGCWDFDGLQAGGPRPDGAGDTDLAQGDLMCRTGAAIEDCTNGVDDNGDCKADCADPTCAGTGLCQPYPLLAYGRLLSTCGAGTSAFGPTLYDSIDNNKTCSKCACQSPSGCISNLRIHAVAGCTDAATRTLALTTQGCQTITLDGPQSKNYFLETPKLACAPVSAGVMPDIAYKTKAQMCLRNQAAKDCTTLSCVLSSDPIRTGLCIATTETSCPDPFSLKTVWYKTYADNRTCACSCASPAGMPCDGDVTWNKKPDCKGGAADAKSIFGDINKCAAFPMGFGPPEIAAYENGLKAAAGTKCTAGGTVTGGEAKLSDAVTVCCVP